MLTIRITCRLPYYLRIADGEYATGGETTIHLYADKENNRHFTVTSMQFDVDADAPDKDAEKLVGQRATQLVNRVNRLLRWHRVLARRPETIEITRGIASPFALTINNTDELWRGGTFSFESRFPPPPHLTPVDQLTNELQARLADDIEPDVASLNVADAEFALRTGRFRETVLLCWSAIDAEFNKHYAAFVDSELADEWAEGREFFKGLDFGLRHKMTIGLRFLKGRSLYSEPDDFWTAGDSEKPLRKAGRQEGYPPVQPLFLPSCFP